MSTRRGGPTGTASTRNEASNLEMIVPATLEQAKQNAADDWWYRGARTALEQLAKTGRGFTADQLLDQCGQPPAPAYIGALFAAATRARLVVAVGCKVARDGRLVRIYWGTSDGHDG